MGGYTVKIYDGQNVRTVDAPLFDRIEQKQHLERVSSKLAGLILEFCEQHRTFRWADLHAFIARHIPNTAPASADRVLRELRKQGRVSYLVERRGSLYSINSVTR
jgi:hypothetical protein